MSETEPVVIDLEDPYYHGQTLPEALAGFDHVHSTTGVCVANIHGPLCEYESSKQALLDRHRFAPKYPAVCSCGFPAGFAMDSETPWIHHVAFLLREAGLADPDPDVALDIIPAPVGGEPE